MMKLKFAAAALAALSIVALSPFSAYARSASCTACFSACWDGYNGNDTMLSMRYNNCQDESGNTCPVVPR